MLRDRLFETLRVGGGDRRQRLRDGRRRLGAGEVRRLARPRTPRARRRAPACTSQGSWRAGTGEVWSVALAAPDGTAAWFDAAEVDARGRRRAVAAWLADADARRRCCTTPRARCWRSRPAAGRSHGAGQRHRARGVPRATRPALLRPGRPDAALPQARAESEETDGRPASCSFDGLDGGDDRRRRDRDAARPGRPRPGRGARHRVEQHGGAGCSPRSSCRWSTCSPQMERAGIAVDTDHLEALEAHFAGEVQAGRRRGARRDRQGDQPRLAQAAAGACSSTSSTCPRPSAPRPATPPTPTRCSGSTSRPSTRSCSRCCGTATSTRLRQTIEGLLKTVARRRPHPHHVQPDDRGHRPALLHRPQPAEHPDPHRGGPADPRGLRRRRRATSA